MFSRRLVISTTLLFMVYFFIHPVASQTATPQPAAVIEVQWSPNNQSIAEVMRDGSVHIRTVSTNGVLSTLTLPEIMTHDIAWSSDNDYTATGGGNELYVWDVSTGTRMHTFTHPTFNVTAVAWAIDDSVILTATGWDHGRRLEQ